MKYCTKCGHEIEDNASFCPKCGCSVETIVTQNRVETYTPVVNPREKSGLFTAGYVFTIIGCVVGSILGLLIPLAWMLPMTLHLNKVKKDEIPLTIAYSVCNLLFVSLLGGIFLLCCDERQG